MEEKIRIIIFCGGNGQRVGGNSYIKNNGSVTVTFWGDSKAELSHTFCVDGYNIKDGYIRMSRDEFYQKMKIPYLKYSKYFTVTSSDKIISQIQIALISGTIAEGVKASFLGGVAIDIIINNLSIDLDEGDYYFEKYVLMDPANTNMIGQTITIIKKYNEYDKEWDTYYKRYGAGI